MWLTKWYTENTTSMIFLPKLYNLNLIIRKHWTNLNWGTFYKINGLLYFFKVRSWKMRKDLGTIPTLRRLKRSNNNSLQFGLDSGAEGNYFSFGIKDISRTLGDIWVGYVDLRTVLYQCSFPESDHCTIGM